MKLGTWLAAMVQPLVSRVLVALGLQVVTITGMTAVFAAIKALFMQHMGQVPNAGFQLALLAGVGPAFGMIFGAIAFRLALWQIQGATKILGTGGGSA